MKEAFWRFPDDHSDVDNSPAALEMLKLKLLTVETLLKTFHAHSLHPDWNTSTYTEITFCSFTELMIIFLLLLRL